MNDIPETLLLSDFIWAIHLTGMHVEVTVDGETFWTSIPENTTKRECDDES